MATLSETWQKLKGAIITSLSSLVVAAVGSGGFAAYQGLKQAFADLAPKAYVHEVVEAEFAVRDAIDALERSIARDEDLLSKLQNPDAIADVEARIAEKREQLDRLRG